MVINSKDAKEFIKWYTFVMAQVHQLTEGTQKPIEILPMIAASRQKIVAEPSLMEVAINTLRDLGETLPDAIVEAMRTLKVKDWVYLRDTNRYSIFLDPEMPDAYAVYGLTNPVSKIIGTSGAIIRIGLMRYKGQYVCDGVVTNLVALGANYKKSFSERFLELKRDGHFHVDETA